MVNLKDNPQTGGCFISLEPIFDPEVEEFTRLSRARRKEVAKARDYYVPLEPPLPLEESFEG